MSSNIFYLVANLWLFSSSKYKILALEDSNFCGEHEDCLLPQTDRILFITVILVSCRVILCRNTNNTSLSSSLVDTYSNPVIISDTSSRPPQQVENPFYSLYSCQVSTAELISDTLVHRLAKKFTSVWGENPNSHLLKSQASFHFLV